MPPYSTGKNRAARSRPAVNLEFMPIAYHLLVMDKPLSAGIRFLAGTQQEDGSFLSLSSRRPDNFVSARTTHATFPAALILSCLCEVGDHPKAQRIRERLAEFLLRQKSEQWSWNYWGRESLEYTQTPYPDDLDDTFCALAALTRCDPTLVDGATLAKAVTLLTAVEEQEGGPYRTWLAPPTTDAAWRDVDLAVNSNVAYFLALHGVSLPNLTAHIESAITGNAYRSRYYPSPYPIIYFISRFYRGTKTREIQDFLLAQRDHAGAWGNPLNTALATTALLNVGVGPKDLQSGIRFLLRSQRQESWQPSGFCIDPTVDKQTHYGGSAALTTAFCLEALARFAQRRQPHAVAKTPKHLRRTQETTRQKQELSATVIHRARERFSMLEDHMRQQALDRLETTVQRNPSGEIVLLPYYFKRALGTRAQRVPDELLIQLGLATLYGWIAYTIYDDFLDGEGEARQLGVANVTLRELTTIANQVLQNSPEGQRWFHRLMDTTEAANTWEVTHCRTLTPLRIPDYGDYARLAERSLGHALGPVAILLTLGHGPNSPEVSATLAFFRHYLIARQLNDDAHDWEDDLKRGNINVVGALILTRYQEQRGTLRDVPQDLTPLREFFWHAAMREVFLTIISHLEKARHALNAPAFIQETPHLFQLLGPVEAAAQHALANQEEVIKFLRAYAGTNDRAGAGSTHLRMKGTRPKRE